MYPSHEGLPRPLTNEESLDDLDVITADGDIHETPFTVFIGHNLGHRVFTMSVPFRQFYEISDVANDRESGSVAQRPLDSNHAKSLAKYMLRGLVSAARMKRDIKGENLLPEFDTVLSALGDQPYFSLQPIVCNIRNIPYGGAGQGGIRGERLETVSGETAAFRVFLSERHTLWVIDGQHRRTGADMVMSFLTIVRQTGKYPSKAPVLFPDKGREVTEDEMAIWNETYEAARAYATLTVEVHLGLGNDQERQLFHDLNKLGKKVSSSLALQFDSSNPVTQFIKSSLVAAGTIQVTDKDVKDWSLDKGEMAMKDVVAVTSLAFLNKSNSSGATPAVIEPRQEIIEQMWLTVSQLAHFGDERSKERTIVAQPVVLKAIAKLTYDFNFSNRRPDNGDELFIELIESLEAVDFSHNNPIWRFYELDEHEIEKYGLQNLSKWLPAKDTTANRDIGSMQNGFMRFGAKHNDIFPIIADMIRYQLGLPSRHTE